MWRKDARELGIGVSCIRRARLDGSGAANGYTAAAVVDTLVAKPLILAETDYEMHQWFRGSGLTAGLQHSESPTLF